MHAPNNKPVTCNRGNVDVNGPPPEPKACVPENVACGNIVPTRDLRGPSTSTNHDEKLKGKVKGGRNSTRLHKGNKTAPGRAPQVYESQRGNHRKDIEKQANPHMSFCLDHTYTIRMTRFMSSPPCNTCLGEDRRIAVLSKGGRKGAFAAKDLQLQSAMPADDMKHWEKFMAIVQRLTM